MTLENSIPVLLRSARASPAECSPGAVPKAAPDAGNVAFSRINLYGVAESLRLE